MEFLILGPLEVRRGTDTVRVGPSKQRALLGVLLLHANETVSTERLVEGLWGERPPATAEKLVQGYVHALRKQLGDGVVETRAPGYRLVLANGAFDLSEFESLAAAARSAPLRESIELRGKALALWRGQPLADVDLDGPDRNTIARLAALRLSTQIEQIDAELELGEHAKLVGELETLTAANPYQERLAAQLMLALYRSGRQTEALETYRALRDRLDDELGLQPGHELRDLEAAILRQDASLAPPPPPPEATPDDDGAVGEPPDRPRRRRRSMLALGAGALSVAVVAVAIVVLVRRDDAGYVAPPNSVAMIDAATNRVLGSIPVGIRPGPIAAGGRAIWVGNLDDGSLSRIDPESGKVIKNIALPATPDAIAFGARAVWIMNGRLGTLYRVDPGFNRVTDAIPVASRAVTHAGAAVDVDGGYVWAAFGDSTLARVDTFPLGEDGLGTTGGGPSGVVFAFGSIWVANSDATVQRFTPLTFEEGDIGEFTVGRGPTGIAAGEGAIWVASTDDDYVTRLDPSLSSESARPIPVGDGPTAVTVGGGAVWVTNTAEGTVSRIDPETNEVEETIAVGNAPSGVTFADGTVWVTVQAP